MIELRLKRGEALGVDFARLEKIAQETFEAFEALISGWRFAVRPIFVEDG